MRAYAESLDLNDGVVFMFLPLAHVLARVTQTVSIDVAGTIAFWSGDPKKVVDEMAEFAPTHFPAVPRVYEKILDAKVLDQADRGRRVQRAIFRWALAQGYLGRGRSSRAVSGPVAARSPGDRGPTRAVQGAPGVRRPPAPGARRRCPGGARGVLEFFGACGVTVLEGYGLAESCAAGTLNTENELRYGTVGLPAARLRSPHRR